VRARVVTPDGLSAHADREEIFRWLSGFRRAGTVCVVHGEPAASESLATAIRSRLGWTAEVPRPGQTIEL
jgi:metallo-beta-lactamase family protein